MNDILTVNAGSDGVIWLLLGTDSGFESRSTIVWQDATVGFTLVSPASPPPPASPTATTAPGSKGCLPGDSSCSEGEACICSNVNRRLLFSSLPKCNCASPQ